MAVNGLGALAGVVLVGLPGPPPPAALLVGIPVLWVVLLGSTDTVRAGAVLGLVGVLISTGPSSEVPAERSVLLAAGLVAVALLVRRVQDHRPTRVVLVGRTDELVTAISELARPRSGFTVTSSVAVATGALPQPGVDLAHLELLAGADDVDALMVLPGAGLGTAELRRLGWALEGRSTGLYVGTGLLDVSAARVAVTRAGGLRVLRVRSRTHHGLRRALKTVVERATAGLALVLLSPLLLVLVLLSRSSSQGPALFRQTRVGLDGRTFTMLKLRTMTVGSEHPDPALAAANDVDGGVLYKRRDDPRVTAVGRVLRRYSLDELPQLVNVVRGDMALVGPRPGLPQELARYGDDPRRRLVVRPGLTGLWQVSGRSDLSWDETVRLDLSYVDNWSLTLDLTIAIRTVRAVLGHRGAY